MTRGSRILPIVLVAIVTALLVGLPLSRSGSPRAVLEFMVYALKEGGYITDHDVVMAKKLAHVLAGGDLDQNTLVTEEYLLDLEREAFLSLCGEEKSQDRMRHMVETNKPLRN